MADDWYKARYDLARGAKVRKLARVLKASRHTALGVMHDYLTWISMHCEDGQVGLTTAELDDELGFRGAGAALCSIGWCSVDEDGLMVAADFAQHNGQSAKVRAQAARRQASRRKRENSNAVCHDDVTQEALPDKRRGEYNTKVRGSTTVNVGAGGGAASPPPHADMPEGFCRWLAAMCGCVPQLRAFRVLPEDVVVAAQEAYGCLPDAEEYVELLTAYYADRMQEDRRRVAFWRPMGAQFFRELGDVIYKHALRWQREVGWKPGAAKKAAVAKARPEPEPTEDDIEARRAAWEEAKKGIL